MRKTRSPTREEEEDSDCEEWSTPDEDVELESAPKKESRPNYYTYFCGQKHGDIAEGGAGESVSGVEQGESSKSAGKKQVDTTAVEKLVETAGGKWTLCDRCEEIKKREAAAVYKNPKLWQLYPHADDYAHNEETAQLQEWLKFVAGKIADSQPEKLSKEASVSRSLDTVAEEDEH
jgi:hypothetical protein